MIAGYLFRVDMSVPSFTTKKRILNVFAQAGKLEPVGTQLRAVSHIIG
jgi:hypothetical protein